MPNHESAEKRMRQNERRRLINRGNRRRLRTSITKLRAAVNMGEGSETDAVLGATVSIIDKAVQKGVIHRNAAARYKSRLTKLKNRTATQ